MSPRTRGGGTHVFRVRLRPRVYREIEIPSQASLYDLAAAIVRAFDPSVSCVDGPLDARTFWCDGAAVGCGHVSGLLTRLTSPLALMRSAAWLPDQASALARA